MLPNNTAAEMLQKMQASTCKTTETLLPSQAVGMGLATGVR
jgi:hypothetical protein